MRKDIESMKVSLVSLLQIDEIDRIVIPIIQRDYAQGRINEQDIRDNFLYSLRNYLLDPLAESHDLDFVYGNINSDKEFIPLDGQQRLTTLFLLHFYLSIHDNCYESFKSLFVMNNGMPRFVYQTRNSSSDFCKALVNNPLNIDDLDSISKTIIEKSPWFSASWMYDSTVSSMLNMLDSISQYFHDTKGLYARLTDTMAPAVTFHVLFMQPSGLKDDLYIKMNSRGLELSPFENLKARIIQKLKPYKEKTFPLKRSETKPIELVTPKDYFSFKMDIDWSGLFWIYKEKRTRQTDFGEQYDTWDIDTPLLNFISTVALDYQALLDNVTNEELTNYDRLKWNFYSALDDKFYLHLIEIFDLFEKDACLDNSEQLGIKDLLNNESKFHVRNTFHNFLSKSYKDAAYDEHIRLFAYYEYIICHIDNFNQDDFIQWMRIVMNLTTNSSWQDVKEFCRAMRTIHWLIQNNTQGILQLLADGKDLKKAGFSPLQFHEEQIKACLLQRTDSSVWKKIIYLAEKNSYFSGQLLSLLNFSGIEDYYNKNNNCSWNDKEGTIFIASFKKYAELLWLVFGENGLKEELTEKQIFRRALLSYGPYCMQRGFSRWSFVINQSRDYSWRRYLQADSNEESKKSRNYFKILLDNYSSNIDFKEYLQQCIDKYPIKDTDWRSLLVAEPRIWENFGNDLFSCFDNDNQDVYILSTKTMGGWHCELRTIFIYYQLPTINRDYQWSQNWETFPSLNFIDKNKRVFNIRYNNQQWIITYQLNEITHKTESTEQSALENIGFVKHNNIYEFKISYLDMEFLKRLGDLL